MGDARGRCRRSFNHRKATPLKLRDRSLIIAEIPHLRRYAWALLRDADAADDLVQSCLERALDKFHMWHSERKLRTWLFSIMHNQYVDMIRHRVARGECVPLTENAAGCAEASAEERMNVSIVLAAIDRLPPDQRDALIMVAVNELSYADAAQVLSIPAGTLMSRLHRGREALRRQLGLVDGVPALRQVM